MATLVEVRGIRSIPSVATKFLAVSEVARSFLSGSDSVVVAVARLKMLSRVSSSSLFGNANDDRSRR